jgi:GT2 family glycosyltransferase
MKQLSLAGYLAENPLTDDELRAGHALRVVTCLRSGEGAFEDGPKSHSWLVLSCARGKRPAKPGCEAIAGESRRVRGVAHVPMELMGTHSVTVGEAGGPVTWQAWEYVATTPLTQGRLLFHAGGRFAFVGGEELRRSISAYGDLIANASVDPSYPDWLKRQRSLRAMDEAPQDGPLMSIVLPAYKTPPALLGEALQSVLDQTYQNWELVVVNASPDDEGVREALGKVDDPRVRVLEQDNDGIVGNTNRGIAEATGDYVCFLDHDDTLEADALAQYARAIADSAGEAGLLYCDEDNIDEDGTPQLPLLKPDYNPDLLLDDNYMVHWLCVRRDFLDATDRSEARMEGAQDYDLALSAIDAGARVVHVPYVLYHWRITGGSSAKDPLSKPYAQDAGAEAIRAHLARRGLGGSVSRGEHFFTYRVTLDDPSPWPSLAVVGKNGVSRVTKDALHAYARNTGASVWVVDRGVEGPGYVQRLLGERNGDLVLFVSNQVDLAVDDLKSLVRLFQREEVFAASPRVNRADGLIDYAGIKVHPDGTLGHRFRLLPKGDGGYVGRTERPYDCVALDAECCLVRSSALEELGMSDVFLTMRYALADCCARARDLGLVNVYYPYATATLNVPRQMMWDEGARAEHDRAFFMGMHGELQDGDPTQNPSFDPWNLYGSLDWGGGAGGSWSRA